MSCGEVTEEYAMQDGELTLVKRKVTKKDVPPDIKAMKLLMGENGDGISDDELIEEKFKLLKMLKEEDFGKRD